MSALRVGLIGCGHIAQLVHLNILTQLPGVELVALAEPDPQRRKEAARRSPAAVAVEGYRELLGMSDVEAVVICLPSGLHAEASVEALHQGKHVYLEKPLATNLMEGRRVLAAWRQAGVVGMIGFNYRFNALYQTARQHIQSGRLGELISARSVFASSAQPLPAWKRTRQTGGGVLLEMASHHIDLVQFLFGQDVREVLAAQRSQRGEGDSATLHLRLASGLLIQSFFSMSAVDEDRFEIYGQAGKLTVDRYRSLNVEITDSTRHLTRLEWLGSGVSSLFRSPYMLEKIVAPSREPSYRAALVQFVASAQGNRSITPDFWDGYRSLAVVAAAEEALVTGRMALLPDLSDEDLVG